jgi:hypothetical protein
MIRVRLALALALGLWLVASPATAITFGQLDGNGHPNVGAMFVQSSGQNRLYCSGTLIAPMVFLTASHCVAAMPAGSTTSVTFDPHPSAASTYYPGTAHINPLYASGGQSNTYDIAVIVLDSAPSGITPASLPSANQLGGMSLRNQRFIAVGYGTVRNDKTGGFKPFFFDGQRRWVDQGFRSLTNSWLNLSMNPSTGNGGTCYGDSGGPHFLGTSQVVVAITVTGDAPCRATDVDYRTDTPSARAFLATYVSLP